MSAQQLDVKKSWQAIRRSRLLMAVMAVVGLLLGVAYAFVRPPMYTSAALVVLPPPTAIAGSTAGSQSIETQVYIAESGPVLHSAGQNLQPALSTETVRSRVKATAVTDDVIRIEAKGTSARQSVRLANAVAQVYLVFVTTDKQLPGDLGKRTGARLLEGAAEAHGGNMFVHAATYGGLGALLGAVAGAIIVLARARGDRRLRLRDEISDAVGLPVLASVSSYPAQDPSDWAELLENYTPTAVDAWSLRKTLHHLELDAKGGPPLSLTVITFADDDKARSLGPQLAAFASTFGITTSLVIDQIHTDDRGNVALDIYLTLVDRDDPQPEGEPTTRTIIALSAGTVTAEELARLAVATTADDRTIDGIVVTDPDPFDRTIGRVAQSQRRSGSRLPTLLTGTARRNR